MYDAYNIQRIVIKGCAPMKHRLPKIRKNSLKEQVINLVRDAIIEGKFKPGEKIPEQELAEQLGVSRTPIREAIQILEQQGLVIILPKNGTFVAEVDPEEVRDSLYARIALEQLALNQAIERSTPEEWESLCKKLNRLLIEMKKAVDKKSLIAVTELDIEWHTILIEAAKNRYLSRVWNTTGLQFLIWSPERNLYASGQDQLSDITHTTYLHHIELFDVIRRKNSEEIRQAIGTHILQRVSNLDTQLTTQQNDVAGVSITNEQSRGAAQERR
jgi:DNA-binding GntR family transcriptional regulator